MMNLKDETIKQGVVTRRSALQMIGGTTLALGLFPNGARAQTPQSGGTLRVGLGQGSTTDSLDPVTYKTGSSYVMACTICNTLVRIDEDRLPQPELAESWTSSDDAKVWTFKIRSGVTFHNGKTLTPNDVVYSLKRHVGEQSKSILKALLKDVTDIKADGDTVVITHATGDADMPEIMGQFAFVIVPEGHDDWTNLIGTGPYIFERFTPGVRMRATRNPNYWKSDAAWLDAVEFTVILDPTARTLALTSGDVDIIDKLDSKIAKRLAGASDVNVIEAKGSQYYDFAMDVRVDPFTSNHVREAMKYAVDRQKIVDAAMSGYGVVGNDHPVPPNSPFYNSELPQRAYDPDKAKFHLKAAGMDEASVPLSVSNTVFNGAVDAAVIYQSSAAAAGINIDVLRETADGYWSDVWMKKPLVTSTWIMRPTPAMMFTTSWACEASYAETAWCNTAFDDLLKASRSETNFEKRKAIFWDMQEIASNDGGAVVFAFPSNLDAHRSNLQGVVPNSAGAFNGARIAETTWFA